VNTLIHFGVEWVEGREWEVRRAASRPEKAAAFAAGNGAGPSESRLLRVGVGNRGVKDGRKVATRETCDHTAMQTEQAGGRGLRSQPAGLTTLFLTELWERFSYYGMRAILVLFMVAPAVEGGLGFDTKQATSLYGTYTMMVYLLALPGGFVADRWMGPRRAVILGGVLMAAGQFLLFVHSLSFFYAGLTLIAIGTGMLKPNISAMVGHLYGPGDVRRDSGFSIYYMGINIGALLAPLVCGWIAESAASKGLLTSVGVDPSRSWHFAFAAAGVGMLVGLAVFLAQSDRLPRTGESKADKKAAAAAGEMLTREEWKRIGAITVLFAFTILFWAAYEQKGASLNLFAKQLVSTNLFGWEFPASWLQSLTPCYVILLAPVFAKLWIQLGDRQPTSARKFALGLAGIGVAFLILTWASGLTAQGKISPVWLAAVYLFDVVGELCLSPVGLSTVTKLAPARFVGLMMGLWFFATSLGNKLAGYLSGFFVADDAGRLVRLYGGIAAGLLAGAVLLYFLTPAIRRWSGEK
jgi:proton-dependent oligopeptide transporter, POT family